MLVDTSVTSSLSIPFGRSFSFSKEQKILDVKSTSEVWFRNLQIWKQCLQWTWWLRKFAGFKLYRFESFCACMKKLECTRKTCWNFQKDPSSLIGEYIDNNKPSIPWSRTELYTSWKKLSDEVRYCVVINQDQIQDMSMAKYMNLLTGKLD